MKILIIGIVASGKTTLAKKLSNQYGISYYEGDCIAHVDENKGKRHRRTTEEQETIIRKIDESDNWIIEDVYRKSQHLLLNLADKIIFLDPPLHIRKKRILIRYFKQKLGIEKCHYKSNLKMLSAMYHWTNEFEQKRPEFENMLQQYSNKLLKAKYETDISL